VQSSQEGGSEAADTNRPRNAAKELLRGRLATAIAKAPKLFCIALPQDKDNHPCLGCKLELSETLESKRKHRHRHAKAASCCAWGQMHKLYPALAHEENRERRRLCLWPVVTSCQVFAGIAKGATRHHCVNCYLPPVKG